MLSQVFFCQIDFKREMGRRWCYSDPKTMIWYISAVSRVWPPFHKTGALMGDGKPAASKALAEALALEVQVISWAISIDGGCV